MAKPELAPSPARFAEAPLSYGRLFSNSRQAVVIVDADRWVIVQVNLAASRMLGQRRSRLIGAPLLGFLRSGPGPEMLPALLQARVSGSAHLTDIRTVATDVALNATVSLVKSGGQDYLLIQPERLVVRAGAADVRSSVSEALDQAAVGFLVTDAQLRVLYANRAFLDMAGIASAADSMGRSLRRWLELSADKLAKLGQQMSGRESVTGLITRLTSEDDSSRWVHMLAVAVPDGPQPLWGFTLTEHASIN